MPILGLCIAHFTASSFRDRRKALRPIRNESDIVLHLEQFTCNGNPSHIKIHSCNYRRINQKSVSIDFHAFLIESCDQLQVRIRFSVLYGAGNERLLLDRWEDVCGFLSGASKPNLLELIYENVGKYTNFNHTCPYSGDIRLHADRISSSDFPARFIIPTGRFRTNLSLTTGPQRVFLVRVVVIASISMQQA